MPIEFPLNSIFEQTFQGHPLADAAWMYYVSAGNRQRVDYFLKDSRGEKEGCSPGKAWTQVDRRSSLDCIHLL